VNFSGRILSEQIARLSISIESEEYLFRWIGENYKLLGLGK